MQPKRQLDLSFVRHGERTILGRKLFSWPFVLTRPFSLDPAPAHMLSIILQSGAGALHGEDRLFQRFVVGEGAAVHIATPGATSVHRAYHGHAALEQLEMAVAPGGHFEYLPEARILFPDAALDSVFDIKVAFGGTALVADAFTLHDPSGAGRMFRRLRATTQLRRPGESPFTVERLIVDGEVPRFTRHRAFGSLYFVIAASADALTDFVAELNRGLATVPGLYAAASLLQDGNGIGVRFAAAELRSLRRGVQFCWISCRLWQFGALPGARPAEAVSYPSIRQFALDLYNASSMGLSMPSARDEP